jgi:hypothetical protein
VIIGIGDADFAEMEFLDSDEKDLVDSQGQKAARDIVQFVPIRDLKSPSALRQATLAEVPSQLLSYMKSNGIKPRPLPL